MAPETTSDVPESAPDVPEPTPDVPEEIKRKLGDFDEEELRSVATYAKKCAENGSRRDEQPSVESNVDSSEFTDRVRKFIDRKRPYAEAISVWKFRRRCDDGCDECPHGPFFRGTWEEFGATHSKHLGPADE